VTSACCSQPLLFSCQAREVESAAPKPQGKATGKDGDLQQRLEKAQREAVDAKEALTRQGKQLAVAQTDLEEAKAEVAALKVNDCACFD
jgi:hypothetical protein